MGLFNRVGDADHDEERSVALDGAASVRARIDMSVGELILTGGARDLMNGRFLFDEELAPKIDYRVRGATGELKIEQSRGRRVMKWKKNRWEIALNDDVQLDLEVHMATGKLDAALSSLRLVTARLEHTTGDASIDLGGHQLELAEVKIEQSTGRMNVRLNGNYAALRAIRVSSTTGELAVDLSRGAWGQDLDGRIDVTTGNAVIRLPHDVGVEVKAKTSLGKIGFSGLAFDGSFYHNEAFGATPATLRLDIRTSVGKLNLEVAR